MIIKNKKVAVIDSETTPFKYGRTPEPFCWGFYDGDTYEEFWGEDCTEQLIKFLHNLSEDYIIYAHNGGKFDFFFLLWLAAIENPVKIINGRIVKAMIAGHEIRDSFSIIPVKLAAYQKDDIDYNWFEPENQEIYKDKILKYLYADCIYLFDLVSKFLERFDLHLTIGGLAIKTLREFHPFEQTHEGHDTRIRPFYFGGRVQYFKSGILKNKKGFKVYDVNSMYPYVMAHYWHPVGENNYTSFFTDKGIREQISIKTGKAKNKMPYFLKFTGSNKGALPIREDDGLLSFDHEYGTFYASNHEIEVALKYKLITIDECHELHLFDEKIQFKKFVDTFIKEKIQSKKNNDKAGEIFSKLLLNSSYGKTAQNPENFKDYYIWYEGDIRPDIDEWDLYLDMGGMEVWTRPAPQPIYYDVAIGASITGAARAVMLDALCRVKRPLYCDTDSVICEAAGNLDCDPYRLGAWDLEAQGNILAIAGKKLYALFDGSICLKMASKGAKLEPADIIAMAKGKTVPWQSAAPNFKLTGEVKFTHREMRMRSKKRAKN